MIVANFTEFRSDLKKYIDYVEDDNELLILKRSNGKGTVMMSIDEYNGLMETIHLMKSKANAKRLQESLQQAREGEFAQVIDGSEI
jgi:antitoxin YefM